MMSYKHLASISILLAIMANPVYAGGLYLTELGTPISVGTAGVGNVTNTIGADSVFTNPAGMTGIKGDQFVGGSQVVLPTMRFDSDSGSTAGGGDGGNAGFVSAIPSAFYVKSLEDDWRIGISLTAQLGGGLDYGKDFVGRYSATKSVLSGYGISPAVAYQVNDKFSVGAGLSFIYTDLDLDVAINRPGPMASDGYAVFDELTDWSYQGHTLAATVKGRYKRHWIGLGSGAASGATPAYYDLYQDPQEKNPHMVPMIHFEGQFNAMRERHELFKKAYPDQDNARGIPYTGLSNARPETLEIVKRLEREKAAMPISVQKYMQ